MHVCGESWPPVPRSCWIGPAIPTRRGRVLFEQPVHPLLGAGLADSEEPRAWRGSSEWRVGAGAAEAHDRRPPMLRADRTQRFELLVIPGVRRGGEEQDASRPAGESVNSGQPIAAWRRRVRFIDDQQIPAHVFERMESFGALDEVHRGQIHAGKRPRVHVRRQLTGDTTKPGRVRVDSGHAQKRRQLLAPLASDGRRREDQRPRQMTLHRELANYQPGFDGLSQPDVVCNQKAGGAMPKHGEGGLELIGQQPDGFGTALEARRTAAICAGANTLRAPNACGTRPGGGVRKESGVDRRGRAGCGLQRSTRGRDPALRSQ